MGRFGKYPGLEWDKLRPLGTHGSIQKLGSQGHVCELVNLDGKREVVGREGLAWGKSLAYLQGGREKRK